LTGDGVKWPPSWRSVPLWSLFRRVKNVGHPDEDMLSVYRDHGVVHKDDRGDNYNKTAEDRNIYQLIEPGWLIVNRMKAWQGSLGISPYRGIVSGHYICYRPQHREESRFLAYLLRSPVYTAELHQLSRGVRPNQLEIDNDAFRALAVRLPSLCEQRAIAEFLDTETTRINALIAKKRHMIHLLGERHRSELDVLLRPERQVALRRVAELLPGYMFSSSEFSPHAAGPRLLRGVNVGVGAIRWDDTVNLDVGRPIPERYRLAMGDIVIGMDRPFISGGTRVARIDEGSEGALLVQRVCRIRASTLNEAILVEHVLRSTAFIAHVEADLTGVSVPHLSDEQIGSMTIPVFRYGELGAIIPRLLRVSARAELIAHRLRKQIGLLQQHRQALITAAVTGELEVPGGAA